MTITASQRITISRLWNQVCKDRGWKSGDRGLRLSTLSEIAGRTLDSMDDIERVAECTKVMNGLKVMLGVSVKAGLEVGDPTLNEARVIRNQILTELVPCLELYIADVAGYMADIMEDKNRWWKIDRPARGMTLMDLDAKPIFRRDRKSGEPKEFPSQLKQMQYTLAARLNAKRKEAGETIHVMKMRAGVPCSCALCCQARWAAKTRSEQAAAVGSPQPETQLAERPF
jgi:hypothetical protein